jgi:membrane protease subunit (stomatin/prohibitin family)
VCGNVTDSYNRETIGEQLKTELLSYLQPAFAKISAMGIRYSMLPAHTTEIADTLNELLSAKWRDIRGLEIVSFGVSSVNASEEDENMIKDLQRTAVMRNPNMAAATLVGAQADAMKAAAGNKGGAMMGFMGLGMAQQAGGMNAQNLFAMGQQQPQQQGNQQFANPPQQYGNQQPQAAAPAAAPAGWTCDCGATGNTGKFCAECGKPQPQAADGWTCPCGVVNKGKFCVECGKQKPAEELLYRCDKCGWQPSDPKKPPKFCPECGEIFS